MLIKEIMKTDVCECTEDTPLAEVYELIMSCPNRYAVVIDSQQHRVPIGIVSEQSICENLVARYRREREFFAGGLMSSHIKRVSENADISDCGDLLTDDSDAIVIVDDKRRFLGLVDIAAIKTALFETRHRERSGLVPARVLGHAMPASVEIPAFGWLK